VSRRFIRDIIIVVLIVQIPLAVIETLIITRQGPAGLDRPPIARSMEALLAMERDGQLHLTLAQGRRILAVVSAIRSRMRAEERAKGGIQALYTEAQRQWLQAHREGPGSPSTLIEARAVALLKARSAGSAGAAPACGEVRTADSVPLSMLYRDVTLLHDSSPCPLSGTQAAGILYYLEGVQGAEGLTKDFEDLLALELSPAQRAFVKDSRWSLSGGQGDFPDLVAGLYAMECYRISRKLDGPVPADVELFVAGLAQER